MMVGFEVPRYWATTCVGFSLVETIPISALFRKFAASNKKAFESPPARMTTTTTGELIVHITFCRVLDITPHGGFAVYP